MITNRSIKNSIYILEKRREYLSEKLEKFLHSDRAVGYLRQEYFALEWALPILKKEQEKLIQERLERKANEDQMEFLAET